MLVPWRDEIVRGEAHGGQVVPRFVGAAGAFVDFVVEHAFFSGENLLRSKEEEGFVVEGPGWRFIGLVGGGSACRPLAAAKRRSGRV